MAAEPNFDHFPGFKRTMETEIESHDGREGRLLEYIQARVAGEKLPVRAKKLLDLMDEFSFQEDFLISIGYQKAKLFADMIREKKVATYIELGGYLGYSALLAADAIKEQAPNGHVWSVEADPLCADIASKFVSMAGLESMITIVVSTGADAVSKMQAQGKFRGVDMLFLDHVEELYLPEFKLYLEKGVIGSGSFVVADNVVRPGAPEYRKYVRGLSGVQSKGIECLITPINMNDEFEVTDIVDASKAIQV
ncbi:hypothetical protein ANO11243_003290 [Dothideomycetidae sp. 11243]|nr:hypothetical protein ANO11243_003290 [fungal sp. No.11243]